MQFGQLTLPDNTPPLSPSRSTSDISGARSSAASSSSSIGIADTGGRMSKDSIINDSVSQGIFETLNSPTRNKPPNLLQEGLLYRGLAEEDIKEEGSDTDLIDGDIGLERGRSGYEERSNRHHGAANPRPVIPRLGSYSKRHSSFDTPREVPFPHGYFVSTSQLLPDQPITSTATREDTPVSPQNPPSPVDTMESQTVEENRGMNESPSSVVCRASFQRTSSTSLPLPKSMHYSTIPPLIPPDNAECERYTNPRAAPIPPQSATFSADPVNQSSKTSPSRCRPPMSRSETLSASPLPNRTLKRSPSPPFLADEADTAEAMQLSYTTFDTRQHNSLPPPAKVHAMHSASSPRPSSFPHVSANGIYSSIHSSTPSFPPPQPPTILTPPPPLSDDERSSRKPAPYEPFLPRDQPPPDNTYMAVETVPSEYRLIVRLPGFQRDSITLAMRRRRILHVVADNWSDGGGHFERRISFGYDADLANVRAEFDGEILRIIVPRRTLPVGYGRPS